MKEMVCISYQVDDKCKVDASGCDEQHEHVPTSAEVLCKRSEIKLRWETTRRKYTFLQILLLLLPSGSSNCRLSLTEDGILHEVDVDGDDEQWRQEGEDLEGPEIFTSLLTYVNCKFV